MTNLFKLSVSVLVLVFLSGCGTFEKEHQSEQPQSGQPPIKKCSTQQKVADFIGDFPLYESSGGMIPAEQRFTIYYRDVPQSVASEYAADLRNRDFEDYYDEHYDGVMLEKEYEFAEGIYPISYSYYQNSRLVSHVYIDDGDIQNIDTTLFADNYAKPISFEDFDEIFGCIDAEIAGIEMDYMRNYDIIDNYSSVAWHYLYWTEPNYWLKDEYWFADYQKKLINDGIFSSTDCEYSDPTDVSYDIMHRYIDCAKNDSVRDYRSFATTEYYPMRPRLYMQIWDSKVTNRQ